MKKIFAVALTMMIGVSAIAGQGAVSEVSEMQVSEKIHAFYLSGAASCCSKRV